MLEKGTPIKYQSLMFEKPWYGIITGFKTRRGGLYAYVLWEDEDGPDAEPYNTARMTEISHDEAAEHGLFIA